MILWSDPDLIIVATLQNAEVPAERTSDPSSGGGGELHSLTLVLNTFYVFAFIQLS